MTEFLRTKILLALLWRAKFSLMFVALLAILLIRLTERAPADGVDLASRAAGILLVVVVWKLTRSRTTAEHRLFELLQDVCCIANFDGTIVSINPAAQRLFGYTRSELVGTPFMLLIHPEDRQNAAHEIQKLAMGQETLELEIRCRAKDGVYRWIRWTSAAGPGDTFFIATGRDATPIRETDSKLARLSIVLDNSEDAIVSKSLDDKIGTWNRAAEDLFRYSAEEIIGRDASVLVPTEQMGEETMMLAKLRAGLYVGPTETVRRRKDGSTVNVLLTMSLIRDRQHHACGVSLIFRETHREDEPHQPATPALVGAH